MIRKIINKFLSIFIKFSSFLSFILMGSVFFIILFSSWPFFKNNGISIFFSAWDPMAGDFGILPMIKGSFFIAFPALLTAILPSLGFAVFASETGNRYFKKAAVSLIRAASAIPTIVYAFCGVFFLVPLLRSAGVPGSGYSVFTAVIVLSILISPTMILYFYQGFEAIDPSLKSGADALGATKAEKTAFLILPLAKKDIYAGIFLGFGRAVGDTMISLMVAGNAVAAPESMWDSARSLTAHIGLVMAADYDSMEFRSIFACGLILYVSTGLISFAAGKLFKRRADE